MSKSLSAAVGVATMFAVVWVGGCGETAEDRSDAGFQIDQARLLLEALRSRFEQGKVRLQPEDAAYENTGTYVSGKLARIINKRVPEEALREKLAALATQLSDTFKEKVEAKVMAAQPDFQAGIAGINECLNIIQQMQAALR